MGLLWPKRQANATNAGDAFGRLLDHGQSSTEIIPMEQDRPSCAELDASNAAQIRRWFPLVVPLMAFGILCMLLLIYADVLT